jgi:hypothetical protein
MPENEVLIFLGGDGARLEAVNWLKAESAKVKAKKIHVININEFMQWVRRELVEREANSQWSKMWKKPFVKT